MRAINLRYSHHHLNTVPVKICKGILCYYEITIVLKGVIGYVIDGSQLYVRSGEVVFIEPGVMRERLVTKEKTNYISFNFYCDEKINIPRHLTDVLHSDVRHLIAAYDKINERPYLDNKEKNEHLLACIISVLEDSEKQRYIDPLALRIMEYIHANINKKMTLKEIGEMSFFSPIYCETVFKRETGKSIIDYATEVKIDTAKNNLVDYSIPLSEIAENLGFNDYNYFSRVFKARSGYSPREYRKLFTSSRQQ